MRPLLSLLIVAAVLDERRPMAAVIVCVTAARLLSSLFSLFSYCAAAAAAATVRTLTAVGKSQPSEVSTPKTGAMGRAVTEVSISQDTAL